MIKNGSRPRTIIICGKTCVIRSILATCSMITMLMINFVCNNVLTIDVKDRIRTFNMAAYDVLLNTSDLNEVIRCELIVKKCLPVLLYGSGGVSITNRDIYKLHIAYKKIYRYIFKMSLRASISDLLNAFNITPIVELIENKT